MKTKSSRLPKLRRLLLRLRPFLTAIIGLPSLLQASETVELRFALFETPSIGTASMQANGNYREAPPSEKLFFLPSPIENPKERHHLRSMEASQSFELTADDDRMVRFAVVTGDATPITLYEKLPGSGSEWLVVLKRTREGMQALLLPDPNEDTRGRLFAVNFSTKLVAVSLGGEAYPIPPGESRLLPEPKDEGENRPLRVAFRQKDGDRWRLIYSSNLGRRKDSGMALCLYPSTRTLRVARIVIP